MRNILVIFAALFLSSALYAQVNVNINLGSQPAWGPKGYNYVENYYLPDIEVYYNVPQHLYYYNEGGRWISRTSLPPNYSSYDLYKSHKVVINDRQPWQNHQTYKDRYSIRNDSKYYKHDNGLHKGWYKKNNGNGHGNGNSNIQGRGNGNGKDHGKGNGNGKGRGNSNDQEHDNGNSKGHGNGKEK